MSMEKRAKNSTAGAGEKPQKIEAESEVVSTLSEYTWKIKNFGSICAEDSIKFQVLESEEFTARNIHGQESSWKIKLMRDNFGYSRHDDLINIYLTLLRSEEESVTADMSISAGNNVNPRGKRTMEWTSATSYSPGKDIFGGLLDPKDLHLESDILLKDDTLLITAQIKLFAVRNKKGWTRNLRLNVEQPETSFHSALSKDISLLLNDKESSDVSIACGDKTFYAHRAILSARSPVFKTMFSSGLSEAKTGCVLLEDMDEDTAEAILTYIYTGEVRLPESESISYLDLIPVVEKYNLTELKNYCFEKLIEDVTQDNILRIVDTVDLFQASEEVKRVVKDFCRRNVDLLLGDPEFKAKFCESPSDFGY